MNDKDNEGNENILLFTPKKRTSNFNSSSKDFTTPKMKKESRYNFNVLNKNLRFSTDDKMYCNYRESPKKHASMRSTPISKVRRSNVGLPNLRRYSLKGEKNKDFDITEEIQELETFKTRKSEILDYINKNFPFKNKVISIDNLDPDKMGADEDCIINYPRLFEINAYSKFCSKITIITTKLSEIYLCQHRFDSQYYIVKSGYNADIGDFVLSNSSKEILNEIKILALIGRHVHVLDYFDAWIEDDKAHLQLEYVGGGSLYDFIVGNTEIAPSADIFKNSRVHNISVSSAFVVLAQISSALIYMHDILHIFHGDIKPSNILVDLIKYSTDNILLAKEECHKILLDPFPNPRLRFKLCDFGRSGATDNVMKMEDGDGRYLPPLSDFHSTLHSMATSRDVYSLALTIYECLGGTVTQDISFSVRKGEWESWPENITDDMRSIIQSMTYKNENQYFSLREIIEIEQIRDLILPEAWELLQYELSISLVENMNSDCN